MCTCYHQLLFCKTVRNFLIDEYDNTNEVVQKCLSHRYKSKQNAIQICNGIFGQTPDETPANNGCSNNSGHNHMENEFICLCDIKLNICNDQNIYSWVLINSDRLLAAGGSWNPGTNTVVREGVVLT